MKKAMMAIAVAASLGGCATVGAGGGATPAVTIGNIQNAAVLACGFLPTAASVGALLTGSPAATTVAQWVDAICSAVQPKAAKRGAPMVNGVAIHGRFVK